jgi:hypothetical protein
VRRTRDADELGGHRRIGDLAGPAAITAGAAGVLDAGVLHRANG